MSRCANRKLLPRRKEFQMKQLVVIPIFWGASWRPPATPRSFLGGRRLTGAVEDVLGAGDNSFSYIDINGALWLIMHNFWYFRGLAEYGIEPGWVYPSHIVEEGPSHRTFGGDDCWQVLDNVVVEGDVPAPSSWDENIKALYAVFVEPGHYETDPNHFGWNDPYRDGASKVWVTANSDLAGGIETYAHEMVEGATGIQIADGPEENGPCGGKVVIDHLRLPTYWSEKLQACWPSDHAVFLAESLHSPEIVVFEEFHVLVR
jgi:hypothetical protein